MTHHLTGPLWGNVAVIGIAGTLTVACFAAMCSMLIRPGEHDHRHPKHQILRDDK